MSVPSQDDFLSCCAKWYGKHEGIQYELSWHGRSDYSPAGTWCWYILLPEEQFYPEEWATLRLERQDRESYGSWRRHWSYDNFPDADPHGGWTFGEQYTYLGRDGKEYERVKVGCDYAHSWDRDDGYWRGKGEIERDVKRSIEVLLKMYPRRRLQCGYSGKWGNADEFYTSANGPILKSLEDKMRADGSTRWLPMEESAP